MRRPAGTFLALMLAVAALFALLVGGTENAFAQQQSQTLVSNLGQSDGTSTGLNFDHAQAFTTGSESAGYTLNSVDVVVSLNSDSALSSKLTATIHSDLGTVIGTLTTPALPTTNSNQTVTFTAPGDGIDLAPNTQYWVVIDTTGVSQGVANFRITASDAEDSGAASGWSIAADHTRSTAGIAPDGDR